MDKKIYIRDFKGNKTQIEIKDFEKVRDIRIRVLSGDELLEATYKDGTIEEFDSSKNRFMSFNDGQYNLPLNLIDEFSAFEGNAYECYRFIVKKVKEKQNEKQREI